MDRTAQRRRGVGLTGIADEIVDDRRDIVLLCYTVLYNNIIPVYNYTGIIIATGMSYIYSGILVV